MRIASAALIGAALVAALAAILSLSNHGTSRAAQSRAALRLSLVSRMRSAENEGQKATITGKPQAARPPAYAFPTGFAVPAARLRASAAGDPTFGQPTISGIGGNGFEQDLRIDPSNPSRIYTSAPGALSKRCSSSCKV